MGGVPLGDSATRRLGDWRTGQPANRRTGNGSDAEVLTFGLVMAYQNAREGYDIDTPFQRVGGLPASYVIGNAGHRIDQELSQGGTFRPDGPDQEI
jgi:hypothetical protein